MAVSNKMQTFSSVLQISTQSAAARTEFPELKDDDFEMEFMFNGEDIPEDGAGVSQSLFHRTIHINENSAYSESAHIDTLSPEALQDLLYPDPPQFATLSAAPIPEIGASQHDDAYPADKTKGTDEPPPKKRKRTRRRAPEDHYQPAATGIWHVLPGADQDLTEIWDDASANAFLASPTRFLGPYNEDVQAMGAEIATYQERCFEAMCSLPPNPTALQVKQMQELVTVMEKGRFKKVHVKAITYKIPEEIRKMYRLGVPYTGDVTHGAIHELDSTPHSCSQHLEYIINALLTNKRICKALMEQKDWYKFLSAPNTMIVLKGKYNVNNRRRAKNAASAAEEAGSASGTV